MALHMQMTPWRGRKSWVFWYRIFNVTTSAMSTHDARTPRRTPSKSGIFRIVSLTGRFSDIKKFIFLVLRKRGQMSLQAWQRCFNRFLGALLRMLFSRSFPGSRGWNEVNRNIPWYSLHITVALEAAGSYSFTLEKNILFRYVTEKSKVESRNSELGPSNSELGPRAGRPLKIELFYYINVFSELGPPNSELGPRTGRPLEISLFYYMNFFQLYQCFFATNFSSPTNGLQKCSLTMATCLRWVGDEFENVKFLCHYCMQCSVEQ